MKEEENNGATEEEDNSEEELNPRYARQRRMQCDFNSNRKCFLFFLRIWVAIYFDLHKTFFALHLHNNNMT